MGLGRQLANLQGGIERSTAAAAKETSAAIKGLIPGISSKVRSEVTGDIKEFLVGDVFLDSILKTVGKGLGSVVSGIGNVASTIIKPLGSLFGTLAQPLGGLLGIGGVGGGFPIPPGQGSSLPAPSFFAPQPGLPVAQQVSFPLPTQNFQLPGNLALPVVAAAPRIAAGAVGVFGGLSLRFATKFPALAAKIQAMRAAGIPMTYGKMRGMLRRWGPDVLLALGVFSAAEVLEMMIAAQVIKPRRMNAGNAKALRRALRRVESFHRLCQRADVMRPKRRTRARPGRGHPTIIAQN